MDEQLAEEHTNQEEQIDLTQRFPELKPINRPPSLGTLNGFGLGMYGRRNFDPETGTYFKTLCFCAIFIPIF